MESKVYANQDWQYIGRIPSAGRLFADGMWCFNVNERTARSCNSNGQGNTGNYYIIKVEGDMSFPYYGHHAKCGQALIRVGDNGSVESLEYNSYFQGGEDLWMRINDSGTADNDGALDLRFVSKAESDANGQRMEPKNSYGDPLGTQYDANGIKLSGQ
jgi:hypothetical protein